jgi:hypothetical protein
MKIIAIWLASAGVALAQGFLVVPNGLGNVEGNSSTVDPFTSSSFRFQQIYGASQFPSGGFITQIAFRIDGANANEVEMFFGGTTLTLSTTPVAPDFLDPIFGNNLGADALTVRTGGASFSGFPPVPGTTAPFNATFSFTTPFFYNPAQGNLLVDLVGAGGQAFFPGAMDAQSLAGDSVSWVYSLNGSSPSGTASTLGLVTRFTINAVPEPSTWALTLVSLSVFRLTMRIRTRARLDTTALRTATRLK